MQENTKKLILTAILALFIIAAALYGRNIRIRRNNSSVEWKTIILYGNDNPRDLEILKNRLDVFAGKGKYSLHEENGVLTLRIPASLSRDDESLRIYLEGLLIAPGITDICCRNPAKTSNNTFTAIRITPESLLDISVEDLQVDGGISTEDSIPVLDMHAPNTRRINLRFQDTVSERLNELTVKGSTFLLKDNRLYKDFSTRNFITLYWDLTADSEDANTLFIEYNESGELYGKEKLLQYVLTHETLSKPFNYCIVDDIKWEAPSPESAAGVNQCPVEELSESCLLIQASTDSNIASDKRAITYRRLVQRLDTLEVPYAIGYTAQKAICVKIPAERLSRTVLRLVFDMSAMPLHLEVLGDVKRSRIDPIQMHLHYNGADSSIEATLPSKEAAKLQQAAAAGSNQVPVYLCGDFGPVARCSIEPSFSRNSLVFKDCIVPLASGDNSWFGKLLQNVSYSRELYFPSLSIDYFYMCEDSGCAFNDPSLLPLAETPIVSAEEVTSKIHNILPEAEVILSDDSNTLRVRMNLPVNADSIEKAFSLMPSLFEACSLNESYYSRAYFYLFDNIGDERTYIIFSFDSDYNLTFSGYLYNGRIDALTEEIKKAIENDTFFKNIATSKYSGWNLRDF